MPAQGKASSTAQPRSMVAGSLILPSIFTAVCRPGKSQSMKAHRLPRGCLPIREASWEAAEDIDIAAVEIEFRKVEPTAFFQRILVDEEYFVNGVEGIDLKFVVAVLAAKEDLDIVVEPDERVCA